MLANVRKLWRHFFADVRHTLSDPCFIFIQKVSDSFLEWYLETNPNEQSSEHVPDTQPQWYPIDMNANDWATVTQSAGDLFWCYWLESWSTWSWCTAAAGGLTGQDRINRQLCTSGVPFLKCHREPGHQVVKTRTKSLFRRLRWSLRAPRWFIQYVNILFILRSRRQGLNRGEAPRKRYVMCRPSPRADHRQRVVVAVNSVIEVAWGKQHTKLTGGYLTTARRRSWWEGWLTLSPNGYVLRGRSKQTPEQVELFPHRAIHQRF